MNGNIYTDKKRFNAIDVLILLGILLIILGIVFRSTIISIFNDNSNQSPCTITFEAERVPNEVVDLLKEDSSLTWIDKDVSLGTLKNYEVLSSIIYVPKSDGSYEKVTSQTEKRVTGTISTTALNDNGCYIKGTDFLAAGMTVTISTETAVFSAIITSITFN